MKSEAKIITEHVYPPTPDRSHDWCAYRYSEGPYGWGKTEVEAMANFLIVEDEQARLP